MLSTGHLGVRPHGGESSEGRAGCWGPGRRAAMWGHLRRARSAAPSRLRVRREVGVVEPAPVLCQDD